MGKSFLYIAVNLVFLIGHISEISAQGQFAKKKFNNKKFVVCNQTIFFILEMK